MAMTPFRSTGTPVPAPATGGLFPGALHLSPGAGAGSLRRERLRGLERLWLGRPAEAWPGRVAAVFSLCGHAHRWTAVRALQAARGDVAPPAAAALDTLRWATVQEHSRRLLLDWPAAWSLGDAHRARALAVLRSAPSANGDTDTLERRWADWLAATVLQRPADDWLQRAGDAGEAWLAGWAEATDTAVARWLAALRPAAQGPLVAARNLVCDADGAWARRLAERLSAADGAGFAEQPEGPHGPCETGPWTRPGRSPALDAHNAWMRMTGRLVDLVRLARPGGAAWLEQGHLDLGGGTGLAWTGMARGVLLHWVRLDARGPGGDHIADCRIVAPTDWNAHPAGVLARALDALPADPQAWPAARALALAFDPCVPVHWVASGEGAPQGALVEAGHA